MTEKPKAKLIKYVGKSFLFHDAQPQKLRYIKALNQSIPWDVRRGHIPRNNGSLGDANAEEPEEDEDQQLVAVPGKNHELGKWAPTSYPKTDYDIAITSYTFSGNLT